MSFQPTDLETTRTFAAGLLLGCLIQANVREILGDLGWRIELDERSGEPIFVTRTRARLKITIQVEQEGIRATSQQRPKESSG